MFAQISSSAGPGLLKRARTRGTKSQSPDTTMTEEGPASDSQKYFSHRDPRMAKGSFRIRKSRSIQSRMATRLLHHPVVDVTQFWCSHVHSPSLHVSMIAPDWPVLAAGGSPGSAAVTSASTLDHHTHLGPDRKMETLLCCSPAHPQLILVQILLPRGDLSSNKGHCIVHSM